MSRFDIEHLLSRYLKGETNFKENELVENWLAENNNKNSEWKKLDEPGRDQWLDQLFTDIEVSADAQENNVVQMQPKRTWWLSIAAAAAILIFATALILEWPAIHKGFSPQQLAQLTVPANTKKIVVLADGSQVWVNAGAVLKYPKSFGGKTREVYLSGEAYFDIVHKASQPFIVHTGNVSTIVLGTAFNINAGKTVVVTVTRGKVSVIAGKKLLGYVIPNQQITYNTINDVHTQTTVDAAKVTAWQQDALHFEDMTFEDAANLLQQRFNIKIAFSNDKVKACRFSGTALSGKSIDQILKVLCAFNNATYQHKPDGSILIDGKGCN
jgi:ferric-dicitrate binding protein FerR (iron transport regulator)